MDKFKWPLFWEAISPMSQIAVHISFSPKLIIRKETTAFN